MDIDQDCVVVLEAMATAHPETVTVPDAQYLHKPQEDTGKLVGSSEQLLASAQGPHWQ